MAYQVAIIAPGEMGSAVGARLAERGVAVMTSLAGRSAASAARAQRAGMVAVPSDDDLVDAADVFFSICPPGEAVGLAQRLQPALARAAKKPIYVDCNAIAPATATRIGAVLQGAGCPYVDSGIIGPAPAPNSTTTRIYLAGEAANEVARLGDFGLNFVVLGGPIGAASALKMSYAGITKGFTAVGAAMTLCALQAGCAQALHRELAMSQPQLFAWLARQVPRMYPKAYRWVAEMEEIGHFLGDETPAGDIYAAIARLYQDCATAAADLQSPGNPLPELSQFYATDEDAQSRKRA